MTFSSLDRVDLTVNAVGNTRSMKLLGTLALLPVAALPPVWLDLPEEP